jgi:endonuclease/exonuclease/phosphatase family metal-dependent hydrolase
LLEAVVAEPGGREWPVGAVHLSARATEAAEQKREAEIAHVLDAFAAHRAARRPHILAGDFNSNAPLQQIDPERCKAATRDAWKTNGGMIPRRIVQRLLDSGYTDSLQAVAPQQAATAASFTTHNAGQRVDYIFTVAIEHPRAAWIEQDRLARYASDHYPIGAEI